jgi:hypothetical protein
MKYPLSIITSIALGIFSFSNALADTAAVDKASCAKLADTSKPFVLILKSGDELIASITQCAKDAKLKGASVSGLGQLNEPTLAYFTSNPNDKPKLTGFHGFYELASLNGNVTANGDNYYTHVHGVLSDPKFHSIAGHINNSKVGMAVEITLVPFPNAVQREVNAKTGFGLIETNS